ncbi:MAG TPA: sialidase family protein [Gemmatimonadales bacterium]|nr:sialidase family protein [Gemmatimonadales bacterium]
MRAALRLGGSAAWWLGALLLGAVACGPAGGGEVPERFTPARLVSADTENGATPMFLVTPDGGRILAWVSAPGGGEDGRLHVAVTPAGATAPATATITDPLGPIEAHGESPPQLAADRAGRIYLQYAVGKLMPGARFPVSALRFVRSDDGGRSWSAPVTVNDAGRFGEFGAHNFHALTVAPDGALLSTWLDAREGKSGVWMSRSGDGGRTWAANAPVDRSPACPCCRTGVTAAADGALFVSWRTILPGDVRDVVVARSDDGGATWAEAVRPRADGWVFPGCPHAGPSMRLDAEGRVHVAWWTGKAGEAGVWYARSDDGGRTFASQPLSTGERSLPAHVQLVAAAGRVVVAWDDGLAESPRILLRESRDGGATFASAELVSPGGQAASFPVLAVVGDSVAVAWSATTVAEHHARAAARPDMKDSASVMPLPRVGQSEIWLRMGGL